MLDLNGEEVKDEISIDEPKRKKIGLFDFIGDLCYDKQYLLNETTEKEFVPFMINRGLSQNQDLIMIANEMNKASSLSKELVHDFYFYIVTKKKRYGKWAKAIDENKDDVQLLVDFYNINRVRALEYLKVLTQDDLIHIREQCVVGGKKK